MSNPYKGTAPTGLFAPAAMGTVVPGPKRPGYLKTKQCLHCPQCDSVWHSNPYDPEDDPPNHRLKCVDGWTPEFLTFTVTYWNGYIEPAGA